MTKRPFSLAIKRTIGLLVLWTGAMVAGSVPLPFKSGSLQKILDSRAGEPFLLALWSLTCPPCREEMGLLANMRRQHPELDVVFISTDGLERADEVKAALKQHGLERVESWLFAGPIQRLRYEIDPAWYGILSRSYFYGANHERAAASGALEKSQIKAWLKIRPVLIGPAKKQYRKAYRCFCCRPFPAARRKQASRRFPYLGSSMNRRKYLQVHLPRWILFCLLGCWGALASASEVLVSEVATPAPLGSYQHHLSQTANGRLILSWMETKEKVNRLRFAVREKGGWSTPRTVMIVFHKLYAPPVVLGLSDVGR